MENTTDFVHYVGMAGGCEVKYCDHHLIDDAVLVTENITIAQQKVASTVGGKA